MAGLPVFFINIRTGHDWGDDFARYLEQARNIMNGLPQDRSGFIPNPDFYIGPQSYPAGFPVILALWGKLFSLEIISLNYLISIFLFVAAIALFLIYRRSFSPFAALCLSLLFLYHPLTQILKTEVLSDIPYTALSLLCLLFYKPERKYFLPVSGLLLAFSVHTRSIGFMLAIAFAMVHGIEFFSNLRKQMKPEWRKYLFFWGSAVIFYLLIALLFPVNNNYSLMADRSLKQTFLTHSYYYLWVLDGSFKEFDQQDWRILGMLAGSAFVTLGIIGWILSLKNHPSHRLIGIYCLLYYLMISFYPYGNAGFRFLLPIFGFILFYVAVALKYFLKDFHFNKKIIAAILTLVLFYQYSFGLRMVMDEKWWPGGPAGGDAAEMITFIKNNVRDNEMICFGKPKALSYYAEKKCIGINESASEQTISNDLDKLNCSYYVSYSGVSGGPAMEAVAKDSMDWKEIFSNSSAKVFQRKK